MYSNFGRSEMPAFRTKASDKFQDDVNNATSFVNRSSMTYYMRVVSKDQIQNLQCTSCS